MLFRKICKVSKGSFGVLVIFWYYMFRVVFFWFWLLRVEINTSPRDIERFHGDQLKKFKGGGGR
jgi:hypothetical protein